MLATYTHIYCMHAYMVTCLWAYMFKCIVYVHTHICMYTKQINAHICTPKIEFP